MPVLGTGHREKSMVGSDENCRTETIVNIVSGGNYLNFNSFSWGMSTMSDVAERVKKIVVEHLGVDDAKVVDNASFIDDLGADSLDTVELVMAFEEEFNCEIPDDAAENILTVKNAIDFIDSQS